MKKLVKLAAVAGIACLCAFTAQSTRNSYANIQADGSLAVKPETRQAKKIYKYKQDKKRTSKFNSIKAECNSLDIVVDKSGNRNFYVSYNLNCENSSKPVSYKIEDGVLYIKEAELEWPSVYINKQNKQAANIDYTNKIYVYIPSDTTLKSFDADTEMSDMHIKNISMEDGEITTESGDLDIRKSVINKTYSIKTGSGDIEIYNSAINGKLDIQTGSGDVDTENTGISGNVSIQTGSGDVDMVFNKKSIKKLGIIMVTSHGDMYINKLYKGTKRKSGYGYKYTKNINGNKTTKPFLDVITGSGDIELN